MGLFDRILKHGKDAEKDELTAQNKSLVEADIIEKAIAERAQSIQLKDCLTIPLSDMAALGAGFASMLPGMRQVVQTMTVGGMGYIPINNLGGESLKAFRKATPHVYAGTFNRGGKAVMAKFIKAPSQAMTTTTAIPIDPLTLVMAAMLVSVGKKLDGIQQTQESILSFLEQDKRAAMQADLNILTDELENYKYNWDNDQYKSNHHMKVLDIKQSAEKNLIFYQQQIASSIEKMPSIHGEQAVNSSVKKLIALFHDERMALYMLAFSSFVEVMLLGNFAAEYLASVAAKVEECDTRYRSQYAQCRDMIRKYASETLEKQAMGTLGTLLKKTGNALASSPVLSKGPVDEWLEAGGDKLLRSNRENAEKVAALFDGERDSGSKRFTDGIKSVERILNNTTDLLFDGENLYLAGA